METNAILLDTQTAMMILSDLQIIKTELKELNTRGKNENLCYKEAQQLLKCSRNTIDEYCLRGYFKKYQPNGKGTRVIFKRSEMENYLEHKKG